MPEALKEGWVEKRSVSAPVLKNWRRRYVVLQHDRICWHRDMPSSSSSKEPAGWLPLGPESRATVTRRGADEPLLSIASGARVLMLRASAEEISDWSKAISGLLTTGSEASPRAWCCGAAGTSSSADRLGLRRASSPASLHAAAAAADQSLRSQGKTAAAALDLAAPRPGNAQPMACSRDSDASDDGAWQSCVMSTPPSSQPPSHGASWCSSGVCPR